MKANGPLVNLLLAAATCAVVVTNIGSLVVMAEIMALCAAFLTGCAASGKLWFARASRYSADGLDLLAGVVNLRHP